MVGIVNKRPNWQYNQERHETFFDEETLQPFFKFMMVLLLISLKLGEGILIPTRVAQIFSKLAIPKLPKENKKCVDFLYLPFRYIEFLLLIFNEIMIFGIVYFTIEAS